LKSMTASIAWPAWMLGNNPSLRFITVSYGAELAEKQGRDTLKILEDPMVRRAFPHLRFTRRSATDFETTMGGGRLSTSLGGTLTGRGADYIIIDDPTKSKDAASQAIRESDKAWLLNTVMTRLNNPAEGGIALVMQRLHEGDLVGVLQEMGGWDELILSAIAQQDEAVPIGGGRFYQRRAGHALHPQRLPLAVLEQIKHEMGSINFNGQYLQDPLPAQGNLVMAEWLKTYGNDFDHRTAHGSIVMSVDCASKDGVNNDWSVAIIAHLFRKEIRILEVFRRKLNFPDLQRHVIRLCQEWKVATLLIEDQASGTQLLQTLRSESPPGVPWPITIRPMGEKISRMSGVSSIIEAGRLLLPDAAPWLAGFKSELLAFPSSKHDDQVDALSQLLFWDRRRHMFEDDDDMVHPPRYGHLMLRVPRDRSSDDWS
jgi:predicted phage terminase large subunit-like protein